MNLPFQIYSHWVSTYSVSMTENLTTSSAKWHHLYRIRIERGVFIKLFPQSRMPFPSVISYQYFKALKKCHLFNTVVLQIRHIILEFTVCYLWFYLLLFLPNWNYWTSQYFEYQILIRHFANISPQEGFFFIFTLPTNFLVPDSFLYAPQSFPEHFQLEKFSIKCIRPVEYYSVVRKKDILTFATMLNRP